ncbi:MULTISPECIES: condensation domain-containing protein [unclassified Actinoplanes]|uniref:condensation domain-containing protein n=1 Tax=unclassified Actinoplanes TaxID=2626549 RepID=UPI0012BAC13C|nr:MULTISPECIES: condensation domain-containing protein [unclassified Actinoplanes]
MPAGSPDGLNLVRSWDVPPGQTVTSVLNALDLLEARHESLRTIFPDTPSLAVRQVILAPRGVSVEVLEVTDAADADRHAQELRRRTFSLDSEKPLRGMVFTIGGVPVRAALCWHHIAVDGWAIQRLHREFADILAGRTLTDPAVSCRELAWEEQSDPAVERTARAVEYWTRTVGDVPSGRAASLGTLRTRWATLRSSTMREAARLLAAECGASLHSVVLAAYCHAIAERDDTDSPLVALISGNRAGTRMKQVVGTVEQVSPVRVQVDPAESFSALVRRVHWDTITAYRHGRHNVDVVSREVGSLGYEGSGFGFTYFYNYMPRPARSTVAAPAHPPTRITTRDAGRDNGYPVYLVVDDDTELTCDLRDAPPTPGYEPLERLLSCIQQVVAAEADGGS